MQLPFVCHILFNHVQSLLNSQCEPQQQNYINGYMEGDHLSNAMVLTSENHSGRSGGYTPYSSKLVTHHTRR